MGSTRLSRLLVVIDDEKKFSVVGAVNTKGKVMETKVKIKKKRILVPAHMDTGIAFSN